MFTGIIEQVGRVRSLGERGAGRLLSVEAPTGDLEIGGSIAVDGCCLTAVSVRRDSFDADLSEETLRKTSFSERLHPGSLVNLERPMKASGRFDGHIVQGHVDGVGRIRSFQKEGDGALLDVEVPEELLRYLVAKGSIAVDGISLTIAALLKGGFTAAIIPYTLNQTNLRVAQAGERVSLEVDVLAKYVEALLRKGA